MKRDGACISLWQHNVDDYRPKPPADLGKLFDVIIVGGGITGVTTALRLQKAGLSCLIAEAYTLCFGTTGGTTAHFNTFFDTPYHTIKNDFGTEGAQLVAYAAQQAMELFKSNISTYGIECGFSEKDGYLFSQDEEQSKTLQDIFDASIEAGIRVDYVNEIPVPVPFQKAIAFRGQAQFHPTRYVMALAQAFEDAGGIILQNCPVTLVDDSEIVNVVTTQYGTLQAKRLVYATHTPPGVNLLHFRCAPYRSYAIAAKLADDAQYPDNLAYDMYDPYHYYRTQEVDGQKYLIAGGEDHKTAHETNTDSCFNTLESYVRKHFNITEVAFKWSSQYFDPSDGLPYIGLLPGFSNQVFVATGYSGNGMTYSHVAAITLSDMILNGKSGFAEIFNPNRVKPVAGFTSFVKENVDVIAQFFKKRFSQHNLDELSDLARGDARVVKFEGDSIALYKDEEGALHAISPVCPHAKCMVAWNRAEKSWDCPCHGSRFSVNGGVLTGPAVEALEPINLAELIDNNNE